MTDTIRVGIIGTGNMAKFHAERYQAITGVEVASCYDVDREKALAFADTHNIPNIAESIEDLLSRSDAVSIVTPDRFHAKLTLQVLAADKHVLCEKPLTLTLDEARPVADAARSASKRGLIHMVNFSYRSSAAFQEAIKLSAEHALGDLRHVHSFYLQSWLTFGIDSKTASDARLWRYSTELGSQGVLGDLGCHILDLTTGATQGVKSIRCDLRTFPKIVDGALATEVIGRPLDANDTAIIEMEFAEGGVGVCHTTRWAGGHQNHLRVEVHGTKGALRFDLNKDGNLIELCLGEDLRKANWVEKKLNPTPNNWERFIASIRSGVQDQPDILRGAEIQAYLDACVRSAESKQWESILAC